MSVTYKTILKSFNLVPEFKGKIICDAGTENLGSLPKRLLVGHGIRQLVAKRDIRFSNSMVEAVFRQFKQKFYLKKSLNFNCLYQLIYKFVKQYNEVIPHSSLLGATPLEKFSNTFDLKAYRYSISEKLILQRSERKKKFADCYKCTKKYLRNVNSERGGKSAEQLKCWPREFPQQ
jgi:hypothetical protein